MNIMDFIGENTYIVAVVLWVIGQFIKSVPNVPNWVIPFVLMALGIVSCIGLMGLNVQAAMQGVLCAGGAVLADQAVKQARKAGLVEEDGV